MDKRTIEQLHEIYELENCSEIGFFKSFGSGMAERVYRVGDYEARIFNGYMYVGDVDPDELSRVVEECLGSEVKLIGSYRLPVVVVKDSKGERALNPDELLVLADKLSISREISNEGIGF